MPAAADRDVPVSGSGSGLGQGTDGGGDVLGGLGHEDAPGVVARVDGEVGVYAWLVGW